MYSNHENKDKTLAWKAYCLSLCMCTKWTLPACTIIVVRYNEEHDSMKSVGSGFQLVVLLWHITSRTCSSVAFNFKLVFDINFLFSHVNIKTEPSSVELKFSFTYLFTSGTLQPWSAVWYYSIDYYDIMLLHNIL